MGTSPSIPPRRFRLPRRVRLGLWLAAVAAEVAIVAATGCMERLFYFPTREATTTPPHLAAAEPVWFTSADGTRLHGWFIPAGDGTSRSDAPTILHVHGNAGNITSHVWFTEFLPPAGFNLFIFDYRGYGRSEASARRRGPLIEDTAAALDALLARPDIDPKRVGMYGHSLGGAIGLIIMEQRPEIRAAVIVSAFSSWRDMAASALRGGPVSRMLARLFIRDDRRPDEAIARIDRPVLILHGTSDSVIPVTHGRRLAARGPTAELIEFTGGDHNDLRSTHPGADNLVIEFLRRNL